MSAYVGGRSRLYWVDWLKVLVIFGVFVFHAALVFSFGSWVIHNHQTSLALSALSGFLWIWGMPLMFALAGAATWLALRSRGPGTFMRQRSARLLVPLAVGIALFSPFQAYLERLNQGRSPGSLVAFYATYLENVRFTLDPRWFWSYGFHLWFLGFLFVFSVAGLPAMAFGRTPRGQRAISAAAGFFSRRDAIFLLFLPAAAVQMALRPRYPAYEDWADFGFWFVFYLLGAFTVADPRLVQAVKRHGGVAFAFGGALLFGLGVTALPGWLQAWELRPDYSAGYMLYEVLRALVTWTWILTCLALGITLLDRGSALLSYANEAGLPFYVIHHPVLVAAAYFIVQWPLGVWPKFILLLVITFAVTMVLYEALVRRVPAVRVAFGLKPRPAVHRPPKGARLRAAG